MEKILMELIVDTTKKIEVIAKKEKRDGYDKALISDYIALNKKIIELCEFNNSIQKREKDIEDIGNFVPKEDIQAKDKDLKFNKFKPRDYDYESLERMIKMEKILMGLIVDTTKKIEVIAKKEKIYGYDKALISDYSALNKKIIELCEFNNFIQKREKVAHAKGLEKR